MKKIVLGIVVVIVLVVLVDSLSVPKDWKEARNKVDGYLTNRYGEYFRYEPPKKTVDVSGDGKTIDGFYVKTKSRKYPKIEQFTNYVEYDGRVKDCWQSVKYAYLLGKDLDKVISFSHKLEVSSLNWEYENSQVFDNYEDYYNSGVNNKTRIYFYVKEKDVDDIKKVLIDVINRTPSKMKGEVLLQVVKFDLSIPNFNSISSQYILGNWDSAQFEFANREINWNDVKFNNENNNCLVDELK